MPVSPNIEGGGVVRLSVFSGGAEVPGTVPILSVETRKAVNRIASARIVIIDGDAADQVFPISSNGLFNPGKEVKIDVGYEDENKETIFQGIVVSHAVSIGSDFSLLIVECRDKAAAMTIERKNANYIDKSDSNIIKSLIGNHSGLQAKVDDSGAIHSELVQYYCTDWDFMLTRAEAVGMLVFVDDAAVTVKVPDTSTAPALKVEYGLDLIEFFSEMDVASQLAAFKSIAWDPATQKIVEQQVNPQAFNQQGDLQSAVLSQTLSSPVSRLQSGTVLQPDFLKKWAEGSRLKSGLSRIRGRMKFQGSGKAKVGSLIEVKGVGDHFNGQVFVSAVRHEIRDGNWLTETEFGISPDWFADRRDLSTPQASGLLPAVEGLQVGVVTKLDGDPLGHHRIQVKVPVMQATTEGVWARLASSYASSGFGSFIVPEINDEVILGYFNNDPSHPVILGSLHSSKRAPFYTLAAPNNIKALVTREKLTLEFDEEKKVITVKTPGGNKMVISDQDKGILLQDQNGNKIEMNDSGITMSSPRDISISATGKIDIKATGPLSLTSSADLKAKGLNVSQTADIAFTAKGNATAELSASAQTTVKGGIVMIN
ncbi:type VI secretion system tip protein VgrG [Candidatus Electronema sp. PJ]|uniref:type VI secretion system tip protein VgrG n=1 Tax=Candidatus Electronema sp. PJ TaxID=3401572 RepID=UPI003AA965BE